MSLYGIGLDHRTAPIALRERLSVLGRIDIGSLVPRAHSKSAPDGVAVLATCNRIEVYADFEGHAEEVSPAGAYRWLADFVSRGAEIHAAAYSRHLIRYEGTEAVRHLCRVAAGLESAIVGEPEILGQVAGALNRIDGEPRHLLNAFRIAVRTGRRARNETSIGRGAASFSSAVANLAQAALTLEERPVIAVTGLGKVGSAAIRVLSKRGRSTLVGISRSPRRTVDSRLHNDVKVLALATLPDVLLKVDSLILATPASDPIVTRRTVARAMRARAGRPLTIIDAGVPRNAEPSVSELEGVRLFNVDDIARQVDGTIERRKAAAPMVEQIIEEEIAGFILKEISGEAA